REFDLRLTGEDGTAELSFQEFYCIRHCWLSNATPMGGTREAVFLADGQEVADLVHAAFYVFRLWDRGFNLNRPGASRLETKSPGSGSAEAWLGRVSRAARGTARVLCFSGARYGVRDGRNEPAQTDQQQQFFDLPGHDTPQGHLWRQHNCEGTVV